MSDDRIILPRTTAEAWAGDVEEIAARIGEVRPDAPELAAILLDVRDLARDLLSDMIAHCIMPTSTPASATQRLSNRAIRTHLPHLPHSFDKELEDD